MPAAEALASSESLGRLESLSLVNTRIGDRQRGSGRMLENLVRLSHLELSRRLRIRAAGN